MSEQYKVSGQIKEIMDLQEFDSGFKKREFVVTTPGDYPQHIKLELIKDKVSVIDPFREGEHVVVSFNLRGNEYKGKFFNNLQAWKVEYQEGKETMAQAEAAAAVATAEAHAGQQGEDNLPF